MVEGLGALSWTPEPNGVGEGAGPLPLRRYATGCTVQFFSSSRIITALEVNFLKNVGGHF